MYTYLDDLGAVPECEFAYLRLPEMFEYQGVEL
jgi:hypothetical protein